MALAAASSFDDDFPWHLGIYDAHCHPTDTMSSISSIRTMKAKTLVIMATRSQDQELVARVANDLGGVLEPKSEGNALRRVIPSFGWHPWFSYQLYDDTASASAAVFRDEDKISHYRSVLNPQRDDPDFFASLPDPRPLSEFITQTRDQLKKYPLALVGEVGLDKAFRIPEAWDPEHHQVRDESLTPGGREGRRLSPYRVQVGHQKRVLSAQLALAGEMQRPVSVHSVSAHGVVFETLRETWKGHERKKVSKRESKRRGSAKDAHFDEESDGTSDPSTGSAKPYPPRICLHSYSGPPETVKQYFDPSVPVDFFFSFSTAINFSNGQSKAEDTIKAVPDDHILVESDLHTAGERMDNHLADIARKVCHLKGWHIEMGIKTLGRNWHRFVFGLQS